jgi:hypothetical protein
MLGIALLVVGSAAGCKGQNGSEQGGGELDTVDVIEAPDAHASLDADRIEVPRAEPGDGVAGALPAGFPSEVPLPRPSSLVDFGPRWIALDIDGELEGVRTAYVRQLSSAGFAARDGDRWSRGDLSLRVAWATRGGGTRLTIEIVAPGS